MALQLLTKLPDLTGVTRLTLVAKRDQTTVWQRQLIKHDTIWYVLSGDTFDPEQDTKISSVQDYIDTVKKQMQVRVRFLGAKLYFAIN